MSENINVKQNVILKDRGELLIDGVENIITFEESYIALATVLGRLNIEGRELKVDSLTKDDGKIHIVGNISGVFYSADNGKKSGFGKFFK